MMIKHSSSSSFCLLLAAVGLLAGRATVVECSGGGGGELEEEAAAYDGTDSEDFGGGVFNVNAQSSQESVKIGNTKTNNYNIHESHFLPTQYTQVVLNVPKLKKQKKTRKSRPPTKGEMKIKLKILEVFQEVKHEFNDHLMLLNGRRGGGGGGKLESVHLNHLERILNALNPKYIATERVRLAAFDDPYDPKAPLSYEPAAAATSLPTEQHQQQQQQQQQQLRQADMQASDESRRDNGADDDNDHPNRLDFTVSFPSMDPFPGGEESAPWPATERADELGETEELLGRQYAEQIATTDDDQLDDSQLSYKRMLCAEQPHLCAKSLKTAGPPPARRQRRPTSNSGGAGWRQEEAPEEDPMEASVSRRHDLFAEPPSGFEPVVDVIADRPGKTVRATQGKPNGRQMNRHPQHQPSSAERLAFPPRRSFVTPAQVSQQQHQYNQHALAAKPVMLGQPQMSAVRGAPTLSRMASSRKSNNNLQPRQHQPHGSRPRHHPAGVPGF